MIIYFDENSVHWSNDNKLNECFLNHQMEYIRGLVKARGYIYLNQIYEMLGVNWEPRCDNHCIENADFTVVVEWDRECCQWVVGIF